MPQIVEAKIDTIAINPYRRLHNYPYIPSKLDALKRSIADVGLWPSVMARPLVDRLWQYELAFGHHRVEAARQLELATVPLIIDKLTDKQMLQYMGRENLEDYNAAFLIQLESWVAAIKSGLVSRMREKNHEPIAIAGLLGWTRLQGATLILNHTAEACHAVYALVQGGYSAREDFADMTVRATEEIAERALARIEQLDKMARKTKRPVAETEAAKRHFGTAAKHTAKAFRDDEPGLGMRDLRGRVDTTAYRFAKDESHESPLFSVFVEAALALIDNVAESKKAMAIVKSEPPLEFGPDF
jgi:hypothetical protein